MFFVDVAAAVIDHTKIRPQDVLSKVENTKEEHTNIKPPYVMN